MERDKEIAKLVNVLGRIARAARHSAWSGDLDAARFSAHQYNKVRARLSALEPAVAALFAALPENASPEVIRIAANELAAYFEDEAPQAGGIGIGIKISGCGSRRGWSGRARTSGCW